MGAGVAGIRAALELAQAGQKVCLVDTAPNIGGTLSQLDNQFPTNHCGMCKMLPTLGRSRVAEFCLRRDLNHPNITLMPLTELRALESEPGKFQATLLTKSHWINPDRCTACGDCVAPCPIEISDPFNGPFAKRKAIGIRYPLAIPNVYSIDKQTCTKCGACVGKCPTCAIDLNGKDKTTTVQIGAVILSTGFDEFDPTPLGQFGYGRFPNVVTSIEFERLLSKMGPTGGALLRPSDGKPAKSIAFLQCVGSRERKRDFCSSACCMYAMKEAMLANDIDPSIKATIFFMDMRTFGREYHKYYEQAKKEYGVEFVRCRVSRVKQRAVTKNLEVTAFGFPKGGEGGFVVADGASQVKREFDLVVLSVGQTPSKGSSELLKTMKVETNEWGFCWTSESAPVRTSRDGVFACGSLAGPKDIRDSMTEACAAAAEASLVASYPSASLRADSGCSRDGVSDATQSEPRASASGETQSPLAPLLRKGETESPPLEKGDSGGFFGAGHDSPLTQSRASAMPRLGVFVCACGGEIGRKLDVGKLVEWSKKQRGVELATEMTYLCFDDDLKKMVEAAKRQAIDRVVIAACVPYGFKAKFERALAEAGVPPEFVRVVNVREHVAWVHENIAAATEKAKSLVGAAIEQLRYELDSKPGSEPLSLSVVVVGGGLCGMASASALAQHGFEVHLVEKGKTLGGNAADIRHTLENPDFAGVVNRMRSDIQSNERVHIHLESEVTRVDGHVGNFTSKIRPSETREHTPSAVSPSFQPCSELSVEHGALVVATGGREHTPSLYLHGKDERVVTQHAFEKMFFEPGFEKRDIKSVVMIQCVESRDEKRPYCSRICCSQALKNARKLRELKPDAQVVVLNRDVMSYGFREQWYTKARDNGVSFVRYEPERKPKVAVNEGNLSVSVTDPYLAADFTFEPDLLVLSPGVEPNDVTLLARALGVELDRDGFFMEAEVKFRPQDFLKDGMFVCGLGAGPCGIREALAQAGSVTQRVIAALARGKTQPARMISEVSERRCAGCEMCIAMCPYSARVKDAHKRIAKVLEASCQGCGVCAMVCPSGATKLHGFSDKQVFAMLDALLV